MSDEEGGWMEEAEDEDKGKAKKVVHQEEKTEAQKLIEAKQRKHEDEDTAKLREIEEQRRIQREKEDEELLRLKQKQAQRQKQREEEERALEQQKKQLEEQRRREEEERKQKTEEEKRKKQEEAERKKAAAAAAMSGGRNFVIEKEKGGNVMDKFMDISQAKSEMGLNTGELATLKRKTISDRVKPLSIEGMDHAALKAKAEELWKIIIQVETSKYDLDERSKRQEYDLRELNERQRQINKKKYEAAGLGADQVNSRFPPKVRLVSKHERQVDRRTFSDKRGLYDITNRKEEQKELNKPAAKKRDTWIKEKGGEERQRHSYAEDLEEEPEPTSGHNTNTHEEDNYSARRYSSNQAEEEVAEEEEE